MHSCITLCVMRIKHAYLISIADCKGASYLSSKIVHDIENAKSHANRCCTSMHGLIVSSDIYIHIIVLLMPLLACVYWLELEISILINYPVIVQMVTFSQWRENSINIQLIISYHAIFTSHLPYHAPGLTCPA